MLLRICVTEMASSSSSFFYNIEFTYFAKTEFSIGEKETSKNFSNRFEIKEIDIKFRGIYYIINFVISNFHFPSFT